LLRTHRKPSILTMRPPPAAAVSAHLADSVRAVSHDGPFERSFVMVSPMPSQFFVRAAFAEVGKAIAKTIAANRAMRRGLMGCPLPAGARD
jgi:hypothetical protein